MTNRWKLGPLRLLMDPLGRLASYAHFALGLPRFYRRPLSLGDAQTTVQRQLADRERNFLDLLRRGIYAQPDSPYLALLKHVGCDLADIEQRVAKQGLEETLRELRHAGVFVDYEEFRGMKPLVRGSLSMDVRPADFDNPCATRGLFGKTSGSTGKGSRVVIDIDHFAAQTPFEMVGYHAHGALGIPRIHWFGILPSVAGMGGFFRAAKAGQTLAKWFTPVAQDELRPSLKNRLATNYSILMGRMCGLAMPWPERAGVEQSGVVAHAVAEEVRRHGACLVRTMVSLAVRVCSAAKEEGLDLTGAIFAVAGEPTTPARLAAITSSGARCFPIYAFSEAGQVGLGCAHPVDGSDVHLYRGAFAVIQHPRRVPGSATIVQAFNFTSLLPAVPKLMLNVESDDYGVLETRACGCPFETHGYMEHMRDIHSFQKLTSEGMTVIGREMIRILEEVLPARFGGNPVDYQIVEEEDHKGLPRLRLNVAPRIHIDDDAQLIAVVLAELGRGSDGSDLTRAIWRQAETFRVTHAEPKATASGKVLPLHLRGHSR